ncbi:lipoate--protein ligase family protein [Thermococci archaeon]|nr:MAG: lipoate--protein ligase family protein [Thermococci archaeon]
MTYMWRSLGVYKATAAEIHASQEVITQAVGNGIVPPTIRIVVYDPPAVTIGYHQNLESSVNIDALKRKGYEVMRRATGGGAVLMKGPDGPEDAPGWEIYVPETFPNLPYDLKENYKYLSRPVVEVYRTLGVNAKFRGKNDIEVNGKKIAGVGQFRSSGGILHTGTFLFDFDVKEMLEVIKHPIEKISDKMIKSFEERVTTVKKETGKKPTIEEVMEVFKQAVEKSFGVKVYDGELTQEEKEAIKKLLKKYRSQSWLYEVRPSIEYTKSIIKKTPGGLIEVRAKITENVIENILITGDFFVYPHTIIYDIEGSLRWVPLPVSDLEDKILKLLKEKEARIIGMNIEQFAKLLAEMINSLGM